MENTTAMERQERSETLPAKAGTPNPVPAPANFQGINISGDTVTLKTADYPEEQRALVRWLHAYARSEQWSWDELEHWSGIDSSTMSRVWSGKYVNPTTGVPIKLDSICERIARCKDLMEERNAARRMPFIETSVFRRIEKVCREALVMQAIACIYGAPQIGKTASLKEVQRRNNHGQTVYVLTPASAGVQAMCKAIAEACNISGKTCFEKLRTRLQHFFDPTKLLIMDEIHEVFVSYHKGSLSKCFGVLRQLQEQSGCGLVLCGTNVFRNEIERGEFKRSLEQMSMRSIWELQLEASPTPEDLALIAKHFRLPKPTGEAAELVKWIAIEKGLGKYVKFITRSAQLAAAKHEPFTWAHFVKTVTIAAKMKEQTTVEWN